MTSDPPRPTRRALVGADSWAERLRAAGLRPTGPRLAILAFLESDQAHPSAQHIFAALRPAYPSLSLSTVYETLDAFLEAGICRSVAGEGALLRVDGTTYPHDHAVCRECGHIFDVPAARRPRTEPPAILPGGLAVTGMRVEFEVVCGECAREAAAGARQRVKAGTPRSGGDQRAARGTERRAPRDRRRGVDRRRP